MAPPILRGGTPSEQPTERSQLAGGALARIRFDQLLLQQDVATHLRVSQPHVAGLEQQADMLLSTLQRYVQALGGQLEIFARFDNVSFCLTRREAESDRA